MATLVIDTYKIAQRLQSKGYSKEQAEGFIEAVQSIDLDQVASKADIQSLRTEIAELKYEILKWVVPLILGIYGLVIFKLF